MTRSWRKRRRKKRSAPGAQAGSPGLCRPLTGSSFLSCALLTTRGFERMQETLTVLQKHWLPGRPRHRWWCWRARQRDNSKPRVYTGSRGQGKARRRPVGEWVGVALQKQNQNGCDINNHNMAHRQCKRPNKEEATVLWRHVGVGPRQILQLYFK